MSLLSSHRLHWGSHHKITEHFRILIERTFQGAPELSSPHIEHPATSEESPSVSVDSLPHTIASRPEVLGP